MLRHLPDCFEAVCLRAGTEENISLMIVWYLFNFENRKCCYWDVIIYIFNHMLWMYS